MKAIEKPQEKTEKEQLKEKLAKPEIDEEKEGMKCYSIEGYEC
jgi:hypothetical protein